MQILKISELTSASISLEVNEKELKKFEIDDTFNYNKLEGFICLRSDHRYGSMVITKINDKECSQIIYGTPKMHYPFDKNGEFRWPKEVSQVEAWEKLDGTNILAYHYKYEGKDFVTFKTRLTPVVRNSGSFGLFLDMWLECLHENSWIYKIIEDNPDYNLSFEMFGSRNPITVLYKTQLDTCLLFGIEKEDHSIKPPSQLKLSHEYKIPRMFQVNKNNLSDSYNLLRFGATSDNELNLTIEGMVLYAHCNKPSWKQFKCKAEQIEQLHWSSDYIQRSAAWTTALNTFESEEEPTFDDYKKLLEEEYTVQQIEKSIIRLRKTWNMAKEHMYLVGEVNKAWSIARREGFDVTKDKSGTMRFISKYFDRNKMRKVGSIILKQADLI